MVSIFINIPGYRIYDLLYNGSRTLVYRGVRESDSLPVVIKLLKNPGLTQLAQLTSARLRRTLG
ncbi:MAG: hypothetical protein V7K67_07865 [Nostoc sp.]|uniref:hypothetical protein n=1 Tax=Nostoc sp. TaxID=1180 RepID=UPI002FF68E65